MQFCVLPVCIVVTIALAVLMLLSFDTLEYQEMGLNYSWISESVEDKTYSAGRYYLGLGNHFVKFPQMVKTVQFLDEFGEGVQGPSLQSRTHDGLNVRLEVSFQYRLEPKRLYELYTTLGPDYEKTFVRMAVEQLTTGATMYDAKHFFANRSTIGQEMQTAMQQHFRNHGMADVPFFQLRTVHLPHDFENAIQNTQVKQQDIKIAQAEQSQNKVSFQTTVIQAEQAVKVMQNQAAAEATAIMAENHAFCRQYEVTQNLQAEALRALREGAQWDVQELLDYMKIRTIREHAGEKTTIRF